MMKLQMKAGMYTDPLHMAQTIKNRRHLNTCGCMVEARRIELLSENRSTQNSPSAVCLFTFPCANAGKQALTFGSRIIHQQARGSSD